MNVSDMAPVFLYIQLQQQQQQNTTRYIELWLMFGR